MRQRRRKGFTNRFTLRHIRQDDHTNGNNVKVGEDDRQGRKKRRVK